MPAPTFAQILQDSLVRLFGLVHRKTTGVFVATGDDDPLPVVDTALGAKFPGAATIKHIVAAGSANPTSVKAAAGKVMGWHFTNVAAAARYVKLHNVNVVPTAGAGVAQTIAIAAGGVAHGSFPEGITYDTGIGLTIVTGSADNSVTAVTAGDVVGDLFYV